MIIQSRFNGPPDSGNGGYSAGVFARALVGDAAAEVTLRRPPPLDIPLDVSPEVTPGFTSADSPGVSEGVSMSGGAVRGPDGELVAEVRPVGPFADDAVPAVSWSTAADAAAGYAGFVDHPFPTCYVCGPRRPDGLRIFPGRLPDGRTAAPFVVPDGFGPATLWAALDCPGGWAVIGAGRPYVLGRIAVVIDALPQAGDPCVVTGRAVDSQGRKASVRSTLYGPTGDRLAYARATWIAI